jgi:hypothetical protein
MSGWYWLASMLDCRGSLEAVTSAGGSADPEKTIVDAARSGLRMALIG